MSFIPESYFILASILGFVFATSFYYSIIMSFPRNHLILAYLFSIIIVNTIYLLVIDINMPIYFSEFFFEKSPFAYSIEFIFFIIFLIYINSISIYHRLNGINNLEFFYIS